MNMIDISAIINTVIPIIIITIALAIVIFQVMKRKGLINFKHKDMSNVDISKAKRKNIAEFNVIDDFQGGFVVTENNTCFTTGIKCIGIGLDKMDRAEQQRVSDGHVVIYNMLTWDAQLYIQSRQMDVESNKRFWEGAKEKVEVVLKDIDEKIRTLESFKIDGISELRNAEINNELVPWIKKRSGIIKQLQGKLEELEYEKACSSPESPQQFDTYLLYSYRFDPSAFTTKLTNDEILDKAVQYLDAKIATTIKNFEQIGVTAISLDKLKCTELMYRAYNPIECDIVTFDTYSEFKTSAFEPYTTTDNVFTPSFKDRSPEIIGGATVNV